MSSLRDDFARLCDEHVRPIFTSGIPSRLQPLTVMASSTPSHAFAVLQVVGFVRAFLTLYSAQIRLLEGSLFLFFYARK